LVGLMAGWLAGKIVRGTGFGMLGDIIKAQAAAGSSMPLPVLIICLKRHFSVSRSLSRP
jgi:hypothetical protein